VALRTVRDEESKHRAAASARGGKSELLLQSIIHRSLTLVTRDARECGAGGASPPVYSGCRNVPTGGDSRLRSALGLVGRPGEGPAIGPFRPRFGRRQPFCSLNPNAVLLEAPRTAAEDLVAVVCGPGWLWKSG